MIFQGDDVIKARKSVLHPPFISKMIADPSTKNADTLTSLGKSAL